MPPTSVQTLILPVTAETEEEIIKKLEETVQNNSLALDLIVHGLDTGREIYSQTPDVTKPPKVLEANESVTTKSTKLPSEDDEV